MEDGISLEQPVPEQAKDGRPPFLTNKKEPSTQNNGFLPKPKYEILRRDGSDLVFKDMSDLDLEEHKMSEMAANDVYVDKLISRWKETHPGNYFEIDDALSPDLETIFLKSENVDPFSPTEHASLTASISRLSDEEKCNQAVMELRKEGFSNAYILEFFKEIGFVWELDPILERYEVFSNPENQKIREALGVKPDEGVPEDYLYHGLKESLSEKQLQHLQEGLIGT